VYASSTSALATGSALTFDGTNLSVGAALGARLSVDQPAAATAAQFRIAGIANLIVGSAGGSDNFYDANNQIFRTGGGSELMRLTSTGLGIGTATPSYRLQVVNSGSNSTVAVGSTNAGETGRMLLFASSSKTTWMLGAQQNIDNGFEITPSTSAGGTTFSTPGLVVLNSGNVGIGTSSPSRKLQVSTAGNNYIASVNTSGSTSALLLGAESGQTTLYSWTTPSGATGVPMTFYTGASEAMRLDTSGNLGIGTSSPSNKFVVSNAGAAGLEIAPTGTASNPTILSFNRSTSAYGQLTFSSDFLVFNTNGTTERMRLDASGNVGIGTSSPGARLQVSATSPTNGITGIFTGSGSTGTQLQLTQGGVDDWAFGQPAGVSAFAIWSGRAVGSGGTERMRLDSSGNLGLGVTPSASVLQSIESDYGVVIGRASTNIMHNAYYSSGGWRYITSTQAAQYYLDDGQHRWFNAPSGTAGNTISFTQAMTLDASGNLGIGLTNPTGRVTIKGALGASALQQLAFQYSASSSYFMALGIQDVSGNAQVMAGSGASLVFYTNSDLASTNERARITSGGDLLVGDTSGNDGRLRVDGTANANNCAVWGKSSGGATGSTNVTWNSATTGDNLFERFYTEGTATLRGSIDYNRAGGLVRYNTTSDYRAKDIIGPVANSGAVIDALKVYTGKMKGATQARPMMIAHEAQEHAPYAVGGVKDEVNADGTPKFQQMDHASMVPLLIAELQSLRARVAQLERQA
jgi:hypothetical protein